MKQPSNVPLPRYEPVQDYLPGTVPRARLKAAIEAIEAQVADVPYPYMAAE